MREFPKAWSVRVSPSPELPEVLDEEGHRVATCHGPRTQAVRDAILLAHAPIMMAALAQCAETFRVMSEHDPGPSGTIAEEMCRQLDTFLGGTVSQWENGPREG